MKTVKKYKYTITFSILWFVIAQLALYAGLNNWQINNWVEVNLYGFAFLGWMGIFLIGILEWY